MNDVSQAPALTQREVLLHALYEASELEHNLMCTYLYAAASLKDGWAEWPVREEAAAFSLWNEVLLGVAMRGVGPLVAGRRRTGQAVPPAAREGIPDGAGNFPARCAAHRRAPR